MGAWPLSPRPTVLARAGPNSSLHPLGHQRKQCDGGQGAAAGGSACVLRGVCGVFVLCCCCCPAGESMVGDVPTRSAAAGGMRGAPSDQWLLRRRVTF